MVLMMKIRELLKTKEANREERGVSLVEAAVALFLLGGVVLVMVFGMSGGAMAVNAYDEQATAQALAGSQMEYTKEYPYDPDAVTYPAITAPQGYTINVTVTSVPDTDENIQKIKVDVERSEKTLVSIQDYKTNR